MVHWGAKLSKPGHSGFLQRWCFLPRSNASQEKGLPSTGPVLAQHWAEYWSSTGAVLGRMMAQHWPSTGDNNGHGLVQCWRNPRHVWHTRKPSHCTQKMSYGECLNVFHMLTHKPAWQGASSKAPLGILKRMVLSNHKTFPNSQGWEGSQNPHPVTTYS